jgi:hypothetical protein
MKMIEIKSRPGVFFKLDDEVAEKIGHWGWCLNSKGYVQSHLPGSGHKSKRVLCSRAVIWAGRGEWPPSDMDVDHVNHDPLDNRMSNLREVSTSGNMRNCIGQRGRSSRFKGVHRCGKWLYGRVGIRIEGKNRYVTSSNTENEEEAARAYDCICHKIGGFLVYNFPDESFEEKWERIGGRQRAQINHSLEKT